MGSQIHEYKTESLNYTKFNYVFIMVSAYYTSVEPVTYNPCKYLSPRNDKRLSNSVVVYCMSIVAFSIFFFSSLFRFHVVVLLFSRRSVFRLHTVEFQMCIHGR